MPRGLVDVIAAGHTHQAVAHEVAGIAIVEAYALGRAFGRVDVAFDRRSGEVVQSTIFPPRDICVPQAEHAGCDGPGVAGAAAETYEGRAVTPDPAIEAAMAPALARVHALQATLLGVVLDTPIPRAAGDSPLGNLFADAQRERLGADVAINNNVRGGLRADLPAGALTLGRLYDVFPFDNRLLTLTITGAELRAVLADEVRRNRRGALALSGVAARVTCTALGELDVEVERANGAPLGADERVTVAAIDQLVLGPVFASVPSAAACDAGRRAAVAADGRGLAPRARWALGRERVRARGSPALAVRVRRSRGLRAALASRSRGTDRPRAARAARRIGLEPKPTGTQPLEQQRLCRRARGGDSTSIQPPPIGEAAQRSRVLARDAPAYAVHEHVLVVVEHRGAPVERHASAAPAPRPCVEPYVRLRSGERLAERALELALARDGSRAASTANARSAAGIRAGVRVAPCFGSA